MVCTLSLHHASSHLAAAAKLEKDMVAEIGAQGLQKVGKARQQGAIMRRQADDDKVVASIGSAATVDTVTMKRSPLAPGGPVFWPRAPPGLGTRSLELPEVSLEEKVAASKESWGRRRKTTAAPSSRRRSPPAPPAPPAAQDAINCEYSEWEDWDTCSVSCGGGEQKRERRVARESEHGGASCTEKLHEKQDCNKGAEGACPTTTATTTANNATLSAAAAAAAAAGAMALKAGTVCASGGHLGVLLAMASAGAALRAKIV